MFSSDLEDLFIEKLYTELPVKKRNSFTVFRIAASIMLFAALGIVSYLIINPINPENNFENTEFVLSDISPDLKEIESYYMANINLTLSEIQKSEDGQSVFDRYMKRLSVLKKEHELLVVEIKEEGPNTMSITALINNLKLQLELLQELKEQITSTKIKKHEII